MQDILDAIGIGYILNVVSILIVMFGSIVVANDMDHGIADIGKSLRVLVSTFIIVPFGVLLVLAMSVVVYISKWIAHYLIYGESSMG